LEENQDEKEPKYHRIVLHPWQEEEASKKTFLKIQWSF
jgi:hypothetical protein